MGYAEFATNSRYIQCEDALKEFKRYAHGMGKRVMIVTACGAITEQVVEVIRASFDSTMESKFDLARGGNNYKYGAALQSLRQYDLSGEDIAYTFVDFEGKQCNPNNIALLAEQLREWNADVVAGVGGGKVMDLVRAASLEHPCKVILVPTSPATNASGSGLVVLYRDDGTVDKTVSMPVFPELVLADLQILLHAPWEMLVAGIGDAIGTAEETEAFWIASGLGRQILDGSWYGNRIMRQVLLNSGRAAVTAAKEKILNHAFESVIPYILNTCGNQRYFRVTFIPHCIDKLLLAFGGPKKLQHGERVGYGVIPQMVYQKRPVQDLQNYVDFCVDVGLPVSFGELGLDTVAEEQLWSAAENLLKENPILQTHPFPFTAEMLVKNMIDGERLVQSYLAEKQK